jgi:predicted RNA-binding protein with RPS1 domain
MSKRPINSAKDFVKRGQDVWVKVLNLATGAGTGPAAQRVSLSMRDVDQATGGYPEKELSVTG